jgi:hypothetical protein
MWPKYRRNRKSLLKIIVKNWPLRRYLGVYAFMPLFFVIGAAIEYSMINWTVGQTNFYSVYKLNRARQLATQQINLEEYIESEKQKILSKVNKTNDKKDIEN